MKTESHQRGYPMARNSRRSFTLVELLTVICILSLLCALLAPALKHARDMAKSLKCQSNLRQIGATIMLYADDNDGRTPPSWDSATGKVWNEVMVAYFRNGTNVLLCPASDLAALGPSSAYGFNDYYLTLSWGGQVDYTHGTILLASIKRPAECIVVGDGGGVVSSGGNTYMIRRFLVFAPQGRHNGMDNYVFADGHVASLPLSEVVGPDKWWASEW